MSIRSFKTNSGILILLLFYGISYLSCKNNQDPSTPSEINKELHFPSGQLKVTWTEINGLKEGIMIEYDNQGHKRAERNFKANLETGRSLFYDKEGRISEVQYYEGGVKHGGDTMFDETGRPRFVLGFANGKKHGYLRKWYEDGRLLYEAKYDMDSLVEVKGIPVKKASNGE